MPKEAAADDRPFEGVRVVEFGQFVSVPYCGQLLAEGGAEVIKVEPLGGDPTRHLNALAPGESRIFLSRNRGKRSLPLKLRDPAAAPALAALLDWADVVLTNFRPGLAERMGLDAASLLERRPDLIVGNVTAFGRAGPDAGLAGMDIVVQARSGLMAANGRIQDGRPAPGDPVSADYMCAMTLAFGVAAALLRRARTGRGGRLDVSLMHAAMALANNQLVRSERADGAAHAAALERLAAQRAARVPFEEQAAHLPNVRPSALRRVYFRTYETADRPIAIACGSPSLRARFAAALGLDDPALDSDAPHGPEWEDHYARLETEAEAIFRNRGAEDWIGHLTATGIPVAAVRFPIELFDDPHARANGMLREVDHPRLGPLRVVGPPVNLDGPGFDTGPVMAPFGSETRAILEAIGLPAETIDALVRAGVTVTG